MSHSSLPSSLCSPTESYADEDLAFMTSISIEDDMDLSMRAPYISMSEADDLPLLISEDLMWGAMPCDGGKFAQQDPKLRVAVDMASVQKSGGYSLSPNGTASSMAAAAVGFRRSGEEPPVTLPQSNRRRRSHTVLEQQEEEENGRAKMMLSVNLFQPDGHLGQNTSSSSCSSEDTQQSDLIEPMFDDSVTKNCEFR